MRYFRSWMFDVGLALIVAGVLSAFQGTTRHGDTDTSGASVRESYTDVSFVAMAGVLATVSGVGAMVVGAARVKRHR